MEPGAEEGEVTKVTHGVEMVEDQGVAAKDWVKGESSLLMRNPLLQKSLLGESASLIRRQSLVGGTDRFGGSVQNHAAKSTLEHRRRDGFHGERA